LWLSRSGDVAHNLLFLAGVEALDPGARGNRFTANHQRPLTAEFVPDAAEGRMHRLAVLGFCEVCQRFSGELGHHGPTLARGLSNTGYTCGRGQSLVTYAAPTQR